MPWSCQIVEGLKFEATPGDMWRADNGDWLVCLPNGGTVNITAKFPDGSSWTVTGEAPNFTVSPSIRCFEIVHADGVMWRQGWHGWLQDGVLSDDCEGRTYPEKE